jgi:rhamnosyltransferase
MGADTKKRLAMYVHYDPKGEVRDYVVFCLQGLSAVVSDILVIVNGMLSDGSRKKLESIKLKVIERENKDFDFGAWKAGIEYLGYDNIAEYDELILTNNSYYGPIYPFSEMCSVMDAKDADFWGINMCPEMDPQLPRHIQSYWMVFRNKILKSDDWKIYWNTLPHFKNIWKAVLQGEAILTGYFENHGFKSAAFMSLDKYDRLIHDNPTIISDMQVMEDRCPIVKRKFFFASKVTESSFGNFIMDFHVKN